MNQPHGLAIDIFRNILIAETGGNAIRKVDHATRFLETVGRRSTVVIAIGGYFGR